MRGKPTKLVNLGMLFTIDVNIFSTVMAAKKTTILYLEALWIVVLSYDWL